MAQKISCKSIIADIRAGKFAPVYILSGEESYYLDLISDSLQANVVCGEDRDFNLDIFYGADTDPVSVVSVARQFPVFAERRLVMLKEAQTMLRAKSALEITKSYMERPVSSTVLVIVYKGEAFSPAAKWVKAAQASGAVVFTSPRIRDYQLAGITREYCSDNGIHIDDKAVAMLSEYVGTDLSRLFGEIEKLRQTVPQGQKLIVTPELIERNIGISKEYNNFELMDALMSKNYSKTMRIVKYFGSNLSANPSTVTASVIFSAFVRLLRAHYMKDKSEAALRGRLALSVPAVRQVMTGMRNYSAASCVRIIREIRRFDRESKGIGSLQPVDGLLLDLVYKIFIS